jgi:hypothetical protein
MNEHTSARLRAAACLVVAALVAAVWAGARASAVAQGGSQSSQQSSSSGQPGQQQPPQENPLVAEIRKEIAGRENQPAEQVFKNIQVLKGQPAGRILNIMGTFTRALGVRCDFCHVPGEWEKDDKDMKKAARDMVHMTNDINAELKKIQTIAADKPAVGCSTCHRGQAKPAAGMGGPRPDGQRPQGQPQPSPSPAKP